MTKESIINKINALLAKTTDNGCTEAEANIALEKATALMEQYTIEQGELNIKKTICEKLQIDDHKDHLDPVAYALQEVFSLKNWRQKRGRDCRLFMFGMPKDVQLAAYLYSLCNTAIETELKAWRKTDQYKEAKHYDTAARVNRSFRIGMADRLKQRLMELKEQPKASESTALVVVKSAVVQEQFAELGLNLSKGRRPTFRAGEGAYRAGSAAADKVQLNSAVKVRNQAAIA